MGFFFSSLCQSNSTTSATWPSTTVRSQTFRSSCCASKTSPRPTTGSMSTTQLVPTGPLPTTSFLTGTTPSTRPCLDTPAVVVRGKPPLGSRRPTLTLSIGLRKAPSPPSRTRASAVHAGPSPPPALSRVLTSSRPVSSSPSLSSSSLTVLSSSTETWLATVVFKKAPTNTTRMVIRLSSSPSTPTPLAPADILAGARTKRAAQHLSLSLTTSPSPPTTLAR